MNAPTLACAAGSDLRSYFCCSRLPLIVAFAMAVLVNQSFAVTKENVDESRVPPYVLPDPLTAADGTRITTAGEWTAKRRPELLRLFETEVYGRVPAQTPKVEFHVESENSDALAGKAIRKEVTIHISTPRGRL